MLDLVVTHLFRLEFRFKNINYVWKWNLKITTIRCQLFLSSRDYEYLLCSIWVVHDSSVECLHCLFIILLKFRMFWEVSQIIFLPDIKKETYFIYILLTFIHTIIRSANVNIKTVGAFYKTSWSSLSAFRLLGKIGHGPIGLSYPQSSVVLHPRQ